MADLNKAGFDYSKYLKPLSLLSPILGTLFGKDLPEAPDPASFGLNPENIGKFYDLKRSLGRAGLYANAGATKRAVNASLPSNLRNSTIPAGFAANIGAQTDKAVAQLDSDLATSEQQTLAQAYQAFLSKYQADFQNAQANRSALNDPLELISLFALTL